MTSTWRWSNVANTTNNTQLVTSLLTKPDLSGNVLDPNFLTNRTSRFTAAYCIGFNQLPIPKQNDLLFAQLTWTFVDGGSGGIAVKTAENQVQVVGYDGVITRWDYNQDVVPQKILMMHTWDGQGWTIAAGLVNPDGSVTQRDSLNWNSDSPYGLLDPTVLSNYVLSDVAVETDYPITVEHVVISKQALSFGAAFNGFVSPSDPSADGTATVQVQTAKMYVDVAPSGIALGDASGASNVQWAKLATTDQGVLQLQGLANQTCRLTNLADPTQATDATNRQWVMSQLSSAVNGISLKKPVNVAVNAIPPVFWVSGIDGIMPTAGFRILVLNAGLSSQNGIWQVVNDANGLPQNLRRPDDFAVGSSQSGAFCSVTQGTQLGRSYLCVSLPGADTVGDGQTNGSPLAFKEYEIADSRIGLFTLNNATITSSTGQISLANNSLTTTSSINAASTNLGSLSLTASRITDAFGQITFQDTSLVTNTSLSAGTLRIQGGQLTDSSGTISLGSTNIASAGNITSTGNIKAGTLTVAAGSLADSSGLINCGTTTLQASRFLSSSDERLKTDIQPLQVSLDTLRKLLPKTYQWARDGTRDVGVIAQDVEQVAPLCVSADHEKMLSVDYPKLIPYLLAWLHHLTDAIEKTQA